MPDCLFCRMIRGEVPTKKVYEDERAFAFDDIKPQAPTHVLIVPKKHIIGLKEAEDAKRALSAREQITVNFEFVGHGFRLPITRAEFEAHQSEWLPTIEDRECVRSLMHPVTEPGKIANWIAPPASGIKGKPFEFEYVRL